MGDIHPPQTSEEDMGGVHTPQTCGNLRPSAAGEFPILPPALRSSPSYCSRQQQPSQPELQPRPQQHPQLPEQGQEQAKEHLYSTCSFASAAGEELHGRRSLQQLIQYYDRPEPAVPVDSTLGGFSVARHTEMQGPLTPVDSEILGLPPLPAPPLPPPPPPESPPLQGTTLDAETAPDFSFAVNQAQAWDTATATVLGSEQQSLLELDPKADVADKSAADALGQEASSQQFFEPVLPAPPREAPWWQETQRRHSIAAPAVSKKMGGADFSHHGLSIGPGNVQRSQSIFDLPEPGHHGLGIGPGNVQRSQSIFDLPELGLAPFAQNGSVPNTVRRVLQPPRGLDLEKISAGLLPPRGLLNPFTGLATPQAACWPGADYSSMRHATSMATPRCALQGSMTPPPYSGSFSMAQRSSVEYRRMAMK